MDGIFSVTEAHIKQLTPKDCMTLFGELLHSDARRIKLSISKVHFTTKEIPDGGIDATVEDGFSESGDLIIDSESFYQIKAGEDFSPWQESEIKRELLKKKEAKKENLGEEVRRCFELNGTYILVCMKATITTQRKTQAEAHLKKILKDCEIQNPKVKVWGPEKIIGAIKSFPSLALRVSNRDRVIFTSHQDWEKQGEMRKVLKIGNEQKKFIKTIQTELVNNIEAIHLNVFGETGVGKTRLIFEATKDPFLSPLTIYCSSPKIFIDSQLMNEIIRDEQLNAILIIDECDLNERNYIWDKVINLGSRIKLITIYNEFEQTRGTTKQIQTPNLSDEKITEIIQTYYDDNIIAGQLAKICGGIPRFAHVIGWDLQNNPDELLRGTPDTNNIFDRYLNYGEDKNSTRVLQRKRILYIVSLFKKFGYSENFKNEMDAIHELIKKIDPNITPTIMHEHVNQLKDRKILQGEDTLYITPKALHLWLWMKYWDEYKTLFNFKELVTSFPRQLQAWFFEMLKYASNSDVTKSIVKSLFDTNGHLNDSKAIQTELGAKFFQILTSIDPKFAIEHLEKTMGTWSPEKLENFQVGRREIIDGLERIVFEPELFTRGGILLRNLAEHENEQWANNAIGSFVGLFSLGPGYVSLTKASPSMRIPLLKETLCSENESRRNLGLKACESALQAMHFTRPSGLSGDELRVDHKGWEPKTYDEWGNAYLQIIDVMIEKIKDFPKEDQRKRASIIFENTRGIIHALPNIAENIIDRLYEIKDFTDKKTSLRSIIDVLEFEKDQLSATVKSRLEKFQVEITGTDYSSLMRRYVGMDIMMDLAKENRDEERTAKICELAKESLEVSKLKNELDWLVTSDAKYGYVFGQELAKLDTSYSLLPMLLDAQRNAESNGTGFFLSGYLLKIFEGSKEKWNDIMIKTSQDEKLIRFTSELAWRSGITDEIGQLLLELIKSEKIQVNELRQFVLGGVVNRLSSEIVTKWIEYMLQTNDQKTIYGAINLHNSFFVHRQEKTLDSELTLRLLTHDVFMGKGVVRNYDSMVDFYWEKTGLLFVKQYPEQSLKLANKMLESIGSISSIVSYHSQPMKVLDKISFNLPNETWKLVIQYIDLPLDERGYAILNWMRGDTYGTSSSFLNLVDVANIIDWVDHDPHKRAAYIIEHVKPELKKENCIARELLIKYGKDESVKRSLAANFFTGGFSGSASIHYQKKKDAILAYYKIEDNENVRSWIDFYVKRLDEYIKREKLKEEREF